MLRGTRGRWIAAGIAVVALIAASCSSSNTSTTSAGGAATGGTSGAGGTINLVAYSTPQAAYTQIEAAFKKTPAGKGVNFKESYGASGDQSRAVAAGQPADYVAFSLEPDVTRLVKANLVASNWNANQYKGFVTNSVVVFVVRKGNPKHIKTWDDLTKSGVQVVTPNPFSSGSARWNIMAGYGAQIQQGKTPAEAEAYLAHLFKNVVVQDTSARNALQTFTGGKGDVLLSYENDAIFAQQKGEPVDYVIPTQTILIQNPAAVTIKSTNPTVAKAFLAFVYTNTAQKIFADNGYRPVVSGVVPADKFKTPTDLFTIDDLGGWTAVTSKFFDADNGIVTKIESSNGVSTKSG
jgi:sulfate/thiosulfate transport system substrate-binding protein